MKKASDVAAHVNNKIPLLTYYSPSHEPLFEKYFYPSYLNHLSEEFELFLLKGEQLCESLFRRGNWNQQVKEKVVFVNNFIQTTSSDFFIFSDVDIIFYKNIKDELLEEIEGFDLGLQNDTINGRANTLCSGFYFCRVNNKTRTFFENIVSNFDDQFDDQQNFNLHLSCNADLEYKALSKRFYNFSHSPVSFWHPGVKIPFPEFPIVMYHANFTIGVPNKELLLRAFKDWSNLSLKRNKRTSFHLKKN